METITVTSAHHLAQAIADTHAAYVCVERSAHDDITALLFTKATRLVEQDNPVLILAVDRTREEIYRKLLVNYPKLRPEHIVTVQDLCLRVLADRQVEKKLDCKARILSEHEYDILLEDLKVGGLKPRRLKEMLKFFYKSITEHPNGETDWLESGEERILFAMLEENLKARQALLACQAAPLALRGLEISNLFAEQNLTVLLDDFGTLNLAAQRFVEKIAHGGLTVFGSNLPTANTEEPYPYFEGFFSFSERHPHAYLIKLASDTPSISEEIIAYDNPQAEFSTTARAVASCINQGVNPEEIIILTPNNTWSTQLAQRLKDEGISSKKIATSDKIKGDPRYTDRSNALRLDAFLKLCANPQDLVALRSWLGFGDWLTRSDAFLELMAYALEYSLSIDKAIATLRSLPTHQRPTKLFSKFDKPLDELDMLKAASEKLNLEDLPDFFETYHMPLSSEMIKLLANNAHCIKDIKSFAEAALSPQKESSAASILITPYKKSHGRRASIVFLTGLVNGFLPTLDAVNDNNALDRKKIISERNRSLFNDLKTVATSKLICSYFKTDNLESATKLKVQINRIGIKDSVRYACVNPSSFIAK